MTSRGFGPRWVAHPPPGLGPPPRVRRMRWPYSGPPVTGPNHPTWGFPPVAVLHDGEGTVQPAEPPRRPIRLAAAAVWCLFTALAALVAAAAEAARFALLLRGRTVVLDASVVRASDTLVQSAAIAALLLGIVAATATVQALLPLGAAAADRAGIAPPRTRRGVLVRLLVPGWNLYGAGQVLVETFRMVHRSGSLGASESGNVPRRDRRLLAAWWSAWIANGAILIATLGFSFGSSTQRMADAVEWHVVLDASAALVAALSAAVLWSLHLAWFGRDARRYRGWEVAMPERSADLGGHAGKHRRR